MTNYFVSLNNDGILSISNNLTHSGNLIVDKNINCSGNINCNQNIIIDSGLKVPVLQNSILNTVGSIYYNSQSNLFMGYNNEGWNNLGRIDPYKDTIIKHNLNINNNIKLDGNIIKDGNTITLPSSSGTFALTNDIPTNNNQLTNGAAYIIADSTDTLTNKTFNYLTKVYVDKFTRSHLVWGQTGTIQFGNNSSEAHAPTIAGTVTDANRAALQIIAGANNSNSGCDLQFNVREYDGSEFDTKTGSGFEWARQGTFLMRLTRDGKLGINTQTPSHKLHVVGDAKITENLNVHNNINCSGNINCAQNIIVTNNASLSNLTLDGNILIGNPVYRNNMSIPINVNYAQAKDKQLILRNTASTSIRFQGQHTYKNDLRTYTRAKITGHDVGQYRGSIAFSVSSEENSAIHLDETHLKEIMRITHDSRVGIMTEIPESTLHVVGDAKISDNLNVHNNINCSVNLNVAGNVNIKDSLTVDNINDKLKIKFIYPPMDVQRPVIDFQAFSTGENAKTTLVATIGVLDPGGHAGGLVFSTREKDIHPQENDSSIGPTSKMFISHNGNVGIGTITPTAKLDVQGDVKISDSLNVNNNINCSGNINCNQNIIIDKGLKVPVLQNSILNTAGSIYYNSESNLFMGYNNEGWNSLGGIDPNKDTIIKHNLNINNNINCSGNINCNQNIIIDKGLKVPVLQNSILNKKGSIYYNSESNLFMGYNNEGWNSLGGIDPNKDTIIKHNLNINNNINLDGNLNCAQNIIVNNIKNTNARNILNYTSSLNEVGTEFWVNIKLRDIHQQTSAPAGQRLRWVFIDSIPDSDETGEQSTISNLKIMQLLETNANDPNYTYFGDNVFSILQIKRYVVSGKNNVFRITVNGDENKRFSVSVFPSSGIYQKDDLGRSKPNYNIYTGGFYVELIRTDYISENSFYIYLLNESYTRTHIMRSRDDWSNTYSELPVADIYYANNEGIYTTDDKFRIELEIVDSNLTIGNSIDKVVINGITTINNNINCSGNINCSSNINCSGNLNVNGMVIGSSVHDPLTILKSYSHFYIKNIYEDDRSLKYDNRIPHQRFFYATNPYGGGGPDETVGTEDDIVKWRINNDNKLEAFLNDKNTDLYTFNNLNPPLEPQHGGNIAEAHGVYGHVDTHIIFTYRNENKNYYAIIIETTSKYYILRVANIWGAVGLDPINFEEKDKQQYPTINSIITHITNKHKPEDEVNLTSQNNMVPYSNNEVKSSYYWFFTRTDDKNSVIDTSSHIINSTNLILPRTIINSNALISNLNVAGNVNIRDSLTVDSNLNVNGIEIGSSVDNPLTILKSYSHFYIKNIYEDDRSLRYHNSHERWYYTTNPYGISDIIISFENNIVKWRINNDNKLEAFLNDKNTDFYTFNNLNLPKAEDDGEYGGNIHPPVSQTPVQTLPIVERYKDTHIIFTYRNDNKNYYAIIIETTSKYYILRVANRFSSLGLDPINFEELLTNQHTIDSVITHIKNEHKRESDVNLNVDASSTLKYQSGLNCSYYWYFTRSEDKDSAIDISSHIINTPNLILPRTIINSNALIKNNLNINGMEISNNVNPLTILKKYSHFYIKNIYDKERNLRYNGGSSIRGFYYCTNPYGSSTTIQPENNIVKWRINDYNRLEAFRDDNISTDGSRTDFYTFNNILVPTIMAYNNSETYGGNLYYGGPYEHIDTHIIFTESSNNKNYYAIIIETTEKYYILKVGNIDNTSNIDGIYLEEKTKTSYNTIYSIINYIKAQHKSETEVDLNNPSNTFSNYKSNSNLNCSYYWYFTTTEAEDAPPINLPINLPGHIMDTNKLIINNDAVIKKHLNVDKNIICAGNLNIGTTTINTTIDGNNWSPQETTVSGWDPCMHWKAKHIGSPLATSVSNTNGTQRSFAWAIEQTGGRALGLFANDRDNPRITTGSDYKIIGYFLPVNTDGNNRFLNKFPSSFTASHRCYSQQNDLYDDSKLGLIVVSIGQYDNIFSDEIQLDNAIPIIELSTKKKMKNVLGVIGKYEKDGEERTGMNFGYVGVYEKDKNRLYINSIGEGAIWVVNTNGNFENGDYIQSSDIPGYGEKQESEFLANYSVAKITMDVDFTNIPSGFETRTLDSGVIAVMVGCIYQQG